MTSILLRALSIGPLAIPTWLALFMAGLIAAAIVARRAGAVDEAGRRRAADIVTGAAAIWLLAWKLTPVALRPAVLFRDPAAIVAAPGGTAGVVAGVIAALAYAVYAAIRHEGGARFVVQLGAAGVAGAVVFFLGVATLGVVAGRSGGDRAVAPDFVLSDARGARYALADYRGKTVLLNFWATWCPPCRAEVPDLVEFDESIADGSVALVSINQTFSEPSTESVAKFAQDFGIEYPILLDEGGRVSRAYGVRGIPTTFVIGPDGLIVERAYGAVSSGWLGRWIDEPSR